MGKNKKGATPATATATPATTEPKKPAKLARAVADSLVASGALTQDEYNRLDEKGFITSGKGVGRGSIVTQMEALIGNGENAKALEKAYEIRDMLNKKLEEAGHKGYRLGIWLKHPSEKDDSAGE
jgi:hypothetical protein